MQPQQPIPSGLPKLPVYPAGQLPQRAPAIAPAAPDDGDYPSLISIFGGVILKTALVAGIAFLMVYSMVGLANAAASNPAKDLSTRAMMKFGALSVGLGLILSIFMVVVAVKMPPQMD